VVDDIKNFIDTDNNVGEGIVIASSAAAATSSVISDTRVFHDRSGRVGGEEEKEEYRFDSKDDNNSNNNQYRVIFDPTPKITSGEGVEGYASLFRSRFEKSLRILSLRPESKRISKIVAVKQKSNSARKTSYDAGGNLLTNSTSIIAGLLMSKHSKKMGLEMIVDDYSGILTANVTNDDLKKQAGNLALDQMVMLEIESNRKGSVGMVVKNIASPDIPDHIPNKSKY
jgi:DNA polymerase II small subunit